MYRKRNCNRRVCCKRWFIYSGKYLDSSIVELDQEVEQSTVHYLDVLVEELRQQPGYKEPTPVTKEKTVVSSTTDTDCRYINQERKKGLGYLAEMTVDTENGIVVGVDCFPANQRESNIILEHIKKIQN